MLEIYGGGCPLFGGVRRPNKTAVKSSTFSPLNDVRHPHCFSLSMEILRTLGQIPLMFIGVFLIVLAIAAVWAFAQSRSRRVRNR
jgi:hypothetical protein